MASTSATDGKVAAWWRPDGDAVRCELCPHRCRIADGKTGICGVRRNIGGTLFATTYGKVSSVQMDPVEKKPLFHFHPGSAILSIGSVGCNFRCGFCQNWHLVERRVPVSDAPIHGLVRAARDAGSVGIAYTYNEPMIWMEFVGDCAAAAHEAGLANVLVTNGFVSPAPLDDLLPRIDAMNIDLKSMDEAFYRTVCGGRLDAVLETIRTAAARTHVELTTLLVPGGSDSDEQIAKVVDFVARTDRGIPLHFSRYFPQHRYTAPPTDPARLEAAWRIARAALDYVYVGNYGLPGAEDTLCPRCGATVVRRSGYRTAVTGLAGRACASCGAALRFVV